MPVTYLIKFEVLSDQRERFLELLNGVLDAMRREPMFHEASLHVDPEDESRFMLCETWEDHDDVLNVQIGRPYRAQFHAALHEVLVKPRDVTVWRPLRSDRRSPD